jgi:hypothetical protein
MRKWRHVRVMMQRPTSGTGIYAHIDQLAFKYMGLDKNPYANPRDVRVMFEISVYAVQGMSALRLGGIPE